MGKIQFEEPSDPLEDLRRWEEIANNVLSELNQCSIEGISELQETLKRNLNDMLSKANPSRYLLEERMKDRVMGVILCVKAVEGKVKENINTNLETIRGKIKLIRSRSEEVAKGLETTI